MDADAVQDSKPRDVTEVPDVEIADEIRHVKLPVGWEGLSLKLHAGKLLVSEVPKACFSSKSFESGAKPQATGAVPVPRRRALRPSDGMGQALSSNASAGTSCACRALKWDLGLGLGTIT
ncbi:unnamed protein product [Symbiodinium sp. CCMP2456]|nr:unnamed protein product [Symbiodinium sp. CCMP2456]